MNKITFYQASLSLGAQRKAIKLGTRERIKENEKESGAQLGLIFCTFFFHILLSKDYLTANPVYTSMAQQGGGRGRGSIRQKEVAPCYKCQPLS